MTDISSENQHTTFDDRRQENRTNNIKGKYEGQKNQLISTIYRLLTKDEYNWDKHLIYKAEEELQWPTDYHLILFSLGIPAIVDYFCYWQDNLMLEYLTNYYKTLQNSDYSQPQGVELLVQHSSLSSPIKPKPKIREQIALALKYRLMQDNPDAMRVVHKKTISYLALPQNICLANRLNWRTCDTIWRYVGDKSLDFNYYSKRGLLLSVYMTSMVYFLTDRSKDYQATINFINKALEKIVGFGQCKARIIKALKPENIPVIRYFL